MPHLATRICASPFWVSQVPVGSAAFAPESMPKSETERSGKANDVNDHGGSKCGLSGKSWRHSYPAYPGGQPKAAFKR